MPHQYCPVSKGLDLLENSTGHSWRPIAPNALKQKMCIATIMPARPALQGVFPIRSQYCYLPKHFQYSAPPPEKLYSYLQTTREQALKVMPSVKYDLDSVKIKMVNILRLPDGPWVLEGALGLTGDIVVKAEDSANPLTFSLNDRTGRLTLNGATQARDTFISSLKISGFVPVGKPSLTIGSSLTDTLNMTSSSMIVTGGANSLMIKAGFTPHYYEIKIPSGLTLEIQVGYEFSGKATRYTAPPAAIPEATYHIAGGLAAAGAVILSVFVLPELLVGGAAALTGGLIIAAE